jgi:histidinol phosphatase-like enzyme
LDRQPHASLGDRRPAKIFADRRGTILKDRGDAYVDECPMR